MKNIFIYSSTYCTEDAKRFISHLESIGIDADMTGDCGPYDYICALGGDGTILDACEIAVKKDLPVFGINLGRVGFLAAFDSDRLDDLTEADIDSLYTSNRHIICTEINGHKEIAVNEIGVFKANIAKSVQIEVKCDDLELGTYRCDGILIATPTGSTAYNLSAGGPVILPEMECCVVTPVCAFTTGGRSVVVPVSKRIRLTLTHRDEHAVVTADGSELCTLGPGEHVDITMYEKTLKLLLSHSRSNYELITGTSGN